MKSFNQFLQESYFSEEEVQGRLLTNRGTAQNFTNPRKIPFTGTDPTPTPASRRLPAGAPEGRAVVYSVHPAGRRAGQRSGQRLRGFTRIHDRR